MQKYLISLSLLFVGITTPLLHGQVASQLAIPNSPAYEEAAARLRSSPARQYDFSRALISDVMRLMAEDAGISFFGLPEGAAGADRLVTFSINASPFSALETLAMSNGISLIFENGIFYLRPANDRELIGRIYQINYNAQEIVRKNDQAGSLSGGGSSGSGGSGASSIGLNLQGAPDFFVTEPSLLLEDIRGILDLETTGRSATLAPTASVDTVGQLSLGSLPGQSDVYVRTTDPNAPNGNSGGAESGNSQAKVIWNSDSNSLYIVATRQQHQWVEGYLAAADQPQPLIAVEVKFLEMSKDPQTELGIDWTGTLAGGYGASLRGIDDASVDEDSGFVRFTEREDGRVPSLIDLDRLADYKLPAAILSYEEVNLKLRALFSDRRNRTVSYPRMITLDNREVSFRSVINQPVLSSSASTSLGAGATETNSVEYVPIGTVINILPKRMSNGNVLMNVSVVISDIVGTEIINGNPFPIASSRVYNAPITVESGYTVAISGLDAAQDERSEDGIPLLGKIPVIGFAFKSRGTSESRQHLMMLITPTLIDQRDPGVAPRPTIRNPWGNRLPEYEPFADDQLPVSEESARDRRKNAQQAPSPAPRSLPPVGPHGGYYPTAATLPPQMPVTNAPEIAVAANTDEVALEENVATKPVTPAVEPGQPSAQPEARTRKGALAKLFGRRTSKPIETGPVNEEKTGAIPSLAAAGIPAWKNEPVPLTEAPDSNSKRSLFGSGLFGASDEKKNESAEVQKKEPHLAETNRPRPSTRDPRLFGLGEASDPIPMSAPLPIEEKTAAPAFASAKPAVEVKKSSSAAAPESKSALRWDGTQLAGGTAAVPSAVNQLEGELEMARKNGDNEKVAEVRAQTTRLLNYVGESQENGNVPAEGSELSDEWWALLKLKTQAKSLAKENAPTLVDSALAP